VSDDVFAGRRLRGDAAVVARLVAVCAAGAFDVNVQDAIAETLGTCLGLRPRCASPPTTSPGGMTFADEVIALALDGTITWDVDIPASCLAGPGCEPAEGSGSCTDAVSDDGCVCSDVVVSQAVDDRLDFEGGRLIGNQDDWIGCFRDGRYLLRRDDGTALGALLIFLPD
jgi:hypothetical protein